MDPKSVWHAPDLVVKLRPGTFPAALSFLREKCAELALSVHFRYTFLDTYFDFDKLYRDETRLMRVFGAIFGTGDLSRPSRIIWSRINYG